MNVEVRYGVDGDWLPATWDGNSLLDPKGLRISLPERVRCELSGFAFHAVATERPDLLALEQDSFEAIKGMLGR